MVALPSVPVIYSFRRCPYAMRARLALLASEQICEHREILLRDKPATMLALSPKGTVPVLWLPDGRVLDESLDVMYWTLHNNDPLGWLEYTSSEILLATKLIEENDGPFKYHLDRYKYADRYEKENLALHRDSCLETLEKLNALLSGNDWLFGAEARMIDYAILPFIRQCRIANSDWFDAQNQLEDLHRWLQNFLTSDIFNIVMHKYDVWNDEDDPVVFPPKA
ncbi:MAG: glutathione S-transferase [Candidatus Micropelagos sp.]